MTTCLECGLKQCQCRPADPISKLAEGAAAAHEVFLAYVRAGFTREEALHLVIAMLQTGMQGS